MSDTDVRHAREALAELEMLVVQDIFLTETGYLADVILPASAFPEKTGTFTNTDRAVQLGRQALDPPGESRQDFWIIVEMAKRLGLDWSYAHPREVFAEMRTVMPSIAGVTWERLEQQSAAVFIPFCYYEAAANLLTNPALDPFGKIPEFKYCAIRVSASSESGANIGYHSEDEAAVTLSGF